MSGAEFQHKSVLYDETLDSLAVKANGCYVDGTTGGGGHSLGILERLGPTGRLYCLDRDEEALAAAQARLAGQKNEDRVRFVKSLYADFDQVMNQFGETAIDGMVLDLGVSSWQLDQAERGFSYQHDGPLDMRMDQGQGESCRDLLKRIDEAELAEILFTYGEEQNARRIAQHIKRYQEDIGEITTTGQLAEIIIHAQPARSRREKGNPAKRSFQALRIAVNGELSELERFLDRIMDYLAPAGIVAIITFHSLEDRIVKQKFRQWENPCTCPKGLPCICGLKPLGKARPRNGILPSNHEQEVNPRAHSARLRVFQREFKVE